MQFAKKDLYDFDPARAATAPTCRSGHFVSPELLDDEDDEETLTDLVSGSVGEGLAVKFMAHRKVASEMLNSTDILAGKVKELKATETQCYVFLTSTCYELKEAHDKKAPSLTIW